MADQPAINSVEVDRMVALLTDRLKDFGHYEMRDAITAVLTFAYQFSKVAIAVSPSDVKQKNADVIANSFRRTAALIEFDTQREGKERVH